ncbi:probable tonb-dependent receptor signal peptide protein [Sorangium cellulosum So ce56]|uniref:Probable tonb-dependent receptor signal peptide protein n=1 Tax=Sorangium cellulosum (strain So ce56) TaxID=448385 RepID=A9GDA6_SORC5|nr:probable tonb-dependent receptor signal peptide protein [Sorangium cellulosum So ce56]
MSFRRSALLLILVALLTFSGRPAWADDLADEADLHFRIATERYSARDYRGALEHFLVSNRLVPNRNVIFNIARTYEALQEYPDAFRYYVQALDLEPNAARRPAIEEALARIRPNVAVINVTTDPPGATVYINRRDLGGRGSTPRLLGFQPGKHKIIVDLEGYEPAEVENVEAKIGEQTNVAVKLKRIVGTVRVVGEMAGTTVRVNDASGPPACTAPCDLTLPPGRHRLYLSQEGYQPSEQDVNVAAASTVTARYRLNPLTGSLVVNADERDALVEVDGKPMGFTPAVLNVQSGQRRVRVSLRGFRPVEQSATVVAGQQTRIDISLRQLEEVEAASRTAEAVEDAPGSVTIISGQELRAMGYPTVAEALRGMRGVYTTYDGTYSWVGIRGISIPGDYSNRVLVLLNGHSINDTWDGLAFADQAARTDLEDVERIEVVRGPGSLLYGTGAFVGVINIVTKGRPTSFGAGVGVGAAQHGFIRGRAQAQVPFGRDSGMWLSVAGGHGQGRDYYLPILPGLDDQWKNRDANSRDADHFNVGTVQGRLWYKSLSAQVFYNERRKALPSGANKTVVGDDRTFYRDRRGFAEVTFAPRISDVFSTVTRVAYDIQFYDDTLWLVNDSTGMRISDVEQYQDMFLLADQRFEITPFPQLKVTVGVEGQMHFVGRQRIEETTCLPNQPCVDTLILPVPVERQDVDNDGTVEEPAAGASSDDDDDLNNDGVINKDDVAIFNARDDGLFDAHPYQILAGYGVVDFVPSDRVRVSAGARIDYYNYGKDDLSFNSGISPRIALVVKPYEGGNLKVTGGRAFRAPPIYELFLQVPASNFAPGFNPAEAEEEQIGPESVLSGEVEFTHRLSSTLSLLGAGYVNYMTDMIAQTGDFTADKPGRYDNTKEPILVLGAEAELRREWRQGWMASLSYSYTRARYLDKGDVDDVLKKVPNSPEHMAAVKGTVPLFGKALMLSTRLTVESPRLDKTLTETDPSVIWDVVLSGQTDVAGLRYNMGVYNVADWEYEAPISPQFTATRMPQAGRTFLLSANLNF